VVEVVAEDGTYGCGVTSGGELVCMIVEQHLSRFVEGRDPGDIESMWDMMWRALIPYGRKGVPIHALSAVDLALWDLHGKLLGQPVFALLGGRTKSQIPVYATTVRPDLAAKLGFVGCKYPCAYGPADGDEGLRANTEIHRHWREAVGPDLPLMIDCYMGLDVPYAIELSKQLSVLGLKWMEEYLIPDDYIVRAVHTPNPIISSCPSVIFSNILTHLIALSGAPEGQRCAGRAAYEDAPRHRRARVHTVWLQAAD
jgi:L-rhamnonate dehydratase